MSSLTIHPTYIPRDPNEPQTPYSSSHAVLRTSDSAPFLATSTPYLLTPLPKSDEMVPIVPRILPVASTPLSLLLNHPNIISLVDIVHHRSTNPYTSTSTDSSPSNPLDSFTVWEDMDAGSLSYLLPPSTIYPDFGDQESWYVLSGQTLSRRSLPEGLCWVVLRSISRALLWLHYGVKEMEGCMGEWERHDDDWMPILIGDVSPGQIWFKKPRPGETYGECKLGGFQWAKVTGSVGGRVAIADRTENAPFSKQLYWAPEIYKNLTPWTRSSEIWSLGATLYIMMTGIPPCRLYNYDWQISRLTDSYRGYSKGLREIVGEMLREKPSERPTAIKLVNWVDEEWASWRANTEEGARFLGGREDDVIESKALGRGGPLVL